MKKNYVLAMALLLVYNALVFGKSAIGDPVKAAAYNCFEMAELTVLHPNCESPLTGTITIDSPLGDNYLYSIDGVNYQESRYFIDLLPGTYPVTYKDISGCTSEVNIVPVYESVPYATLDPSPESSPSQTVCINTGMVPVAFTLGGTASQAFATGLPAGISGVLSDGIFTISGTPSASGVYGYSITTDGQCPASVTGTIVVRLNAAIAWISSSGSRNQALCLGMAINPVKYIIANGATGAVADGLPDGVTGTFSAGIFTLSGTPTYPGNYSFTVTTVGGCSEAVSLGSLAVSAFAVLNLQCGGQTQNPQAVVFNWDAIPGATAYDYSYTINGGSAVSGTTGGMPQFLVDNVPAGQSVVFTINAASGVVCLNPQSVTCTQELLGNETFERDAFNYYPNPVRDVLQIHAKDPIKTILVFDMLGQKVMALYDTGHILSMDVSGLQKGIYLMYLVSDKVQKTVRIMKE